jgi:HEXXH motif-containing protein
MLLDAEVLGGAADAVASARGRLSAGPVSPWSFAHYAATVRAVSRGDSAEEQARMMAEAIQGPMPTRILPFGNATLPDESWEVTRDVFDTDQGRPFTPVTPAAEDIDATSRELNAALELLERADGEAFRELDGLIAVTILGARPEGSDTGFDGASTFFLWGAPVINAGLRRTPAQLIDLLVHEASHLILLGVAAGAPLSRNDPRSLYASPLRVDPRPIDGILHAAYVCTRVHLVLTRALAANSLDADARRDLEDRRTFNGTAAVESLAVVKDHLEPTELGAETVRLLDQYWSGRDEPTD